MTTLLLDVGNSRLKWGLLVDGIIGETGYLPLDKLGRGDASLESLLPEKIESAIACNVAGAKIAETLAELVAATCGVTLRFVRSSAAAGGVQNAYREPDRLGVDRWVAMIGARATTGAACLVVDAGTAITLDAIDRDGRHLGGQILPGLRLMAVALDRSTSDLPQVDTRLLRDNTAGGLLANSTEEAISRGILSAVLGAVEHVARSIRETDPDTILLLTGGDAELIQKHLQFAATLRPHLVLEGLACLLLEGKSH